MPQSYTSLIYHLVFSTKRREPTIEPDIQSRLHEYIGGILRSQKGVLLEAGGTDNHIHLLAGIYRQIAVSAFMPSSSPIRISS